MKRDMRMTILKSEVAEKYAIPNFGPCPFHKARQISWCAPSTYA